MDQKSFSNHESTRIFSPFSNFFKRIASAIGVFTDTSAYKDEIARYESEIQHKAGYEKEPWLTNATEESEPATQA